MFLFCEIHQGHLHPKYYNPPALTWDSSASQVVWENLITAGTIQATISREEAGRKITQVTVFKLIQINSYFSRILEEYRRAVPLKDDT